MRVFKGPILHFTEMPPVNKIMRKGGSLGLVVIGDDSCLKGCGFESWRHILDGHFFTYICCKNCIVCLNRSKINEKGRGWPI